MDVPFMSSGAMSRAHYALVRKVETAVSAQAADAMLYAEVEVIQHRLQTATLSLKQIKESLIILLYCCTAIDPGTVFDVQFALPHAISLAEAGKTVQDKRIGYLYCTEIMPRNHELQLMLVNTLRKDLESSAIPRICLALDSIIHIAPEDVYPAIQDRLYELLSHTSQYVRRRTLMAFRTLSEQSTDILRRILGKMRQRLNDEDFTVVSAALTVSITLMTVKLMSREHFHPILTRLFRRVWNSRAGQDARALLFKVMQTVDVVGPSEADFEIMRDIITSSMRDVVMLNALKYQCFLLASAHSDQVQTPTASTLLKGIRHWLVSEDPNELYAFVSCLNCLEPALWAGQGDIPTILEAWEVERIVNLLHSEDPLVRLKTLRVLLRVDRSIVETYYQKLLDSVEAPTSGPRRCLQVADVLSDQDGESYAQHLIQLLRITGDDISHRHFLKDAVEVSLTHIHDSSPEFRSGCIGVLFTVLVEQHEDMGPTLLTILTALACEYLDDSLVAPEKIIASLTRVLLLYPADVQEICLLTMLRVSAKCESIPSEVLQTVQKLKEAAGRHIKKRCEQFLSLSQNKTLLSQLLAQSRLTLPGMLLALESLKFREASQPLLRSPRLVSGSNENSRPSSRSSTRDNKLRYTAYDAPKPTPRLRRMSSSSSRSADARDSEDLLSRTVTAGDLALAGGSRDLQGLAKSPVLTPASSSPLPKPLTDELASQVDLLGLDSPFLNEPPATAIPQVNSSVELDFEQVWTTLAHANSRGWCEVTIDVVVRKLQSMQYTMRVLASDQPPFLGELKITLLPSLGSDHSGIAVLRLKESEDDSCLWQLRCGSDDLRAHIRELLTDVEH